MNVLNTALAASGLAVHVFENTVEDGATQPEMKKSVFGLLGLVLVSGQILMVLLVYAIAKLLAGAWGAARVQVLYRNLLLIFLVFIWMQLIITAFKRKYFEERRREKISVKKCSVLAICSRFEAAVVAVNLYLLNQVSLKNAVYITAFTVLGALAGLWYGYWCGPEYPRQVRIADGAIIAFMALRIILT